jgi:hypothetical protein
MPTYIKELPDTDLLKENFCIIDGFICWKEKVISRGRKSVRAGKRITNYLDDSGYTRVAIKRETYLASRLIYQMTYGDLTTEFEVDHIDQNKQNNDASNLRKVHQSINKRNKPKQVKSRTNTSGVNLCVKRHPVPYQHKTSSYYVARWYDTDGVLHGKNFNILKLGEAEAFRLACEYRTKMIEELNSQGAGYTDRHGK